MQLFYSVSFSINKIIICIKKFDIMFIFPDPVLFSIGPVQIHWYAFAYVLTIIISYIFLKKQNKTLNIASEQQIDDFSTYVTLALLLGGRFGYVIFYDFIFYLHNPAKILQVWEGGMSWHGAFIAICATIVLFCKKNNIPIFKLSDLIVRTIPIGFFFGRIANFLNQELLGRPVAPNFPLAIIFPNDSQQISRHPSQLYEAFGEGLMLFLLINLCAKFFPSKKGLNSIMFILGYGIIRFVCEFFRQPDSQIGFIFAHFTLGQIFNLLMIIGVIAYFGHQIYQKRLLNEKIKMLIK